MPDFHHLLLFTGAGLLLNLTPGPDVFFILTQALRRGARAGMVAALGVMAGCCLHVVAATAGISALVAASAQAFNLLKWMGAGYLGYVGGRMLWSALRGESILVGSSDTGQAVAAPVADMPGIFRRGFLTNVLNPKVALFFLAFLPQFIAPDTPVAQKPWVFLALGLLFTLNSLWVCMGWALAAAWAARRSTLLRSALRWLDGVAGGLFGAFGVKLALSDIPGAHL